MPELKQATSPPPPATETAIEKTTILSIKQHSETSDKAHNSHDLSNEHQYEQLDYFDEQQLVTNFDHTISQRRHLSRRESNESRQQHDPNQLADFNEQHIIPTSTTRVLTDENGHSIKIRIASPPPQRHERHTGHGCNGPINSAIGQLGGIVNLMQQQFIDPSSSSSSSALPPTAAGRQQRDSLASDCPLISSPVGRGGGGGSCGGEFSEPQEQAKVGPANEALTFKPKPKDAMLDFSITPSGSHPSATAVVAPTTGSKRRRHSEVFCVHSTTRANH